MNKTGKRWICFLALLMCLCLLLTSCAPAPQQPAGNSEAQVENLAKLCKVWGYVKYTHPVFLLGEKDWDEELLKLIPAVSEADSDEVNRILHEWVVSLGEVEDHAGKEALEWDEDALIVKSDTSWILDKNYLGTELTADLAQLIPVPDLDRSRAPVKFGTNGAPDFSNEPVDETPNYRDANFRLLGLFRLWNAIEYYFPHLDLLGEEWDELLTTYIPLMLEGKDKSSFELALSAMAAQLHDGHAALLNPESLLEEFGMYAIPVDLIQAEGKLVVQQAYGEDNPLQPGDVVLALDGVPMEQLIEQRKNYLSVPNDEKIISSIAPFLLRSRDSYMQLTVLRDGEEKTLTIEGVIGAFNLSKQEEAVCKILEGNIGLVNPSAPQEKNIESELKQLRNTKGLVIDFRQYPQQDWSKLLPYLVKEKSQVLKVGFPVQSCPGTMYLEEYSLGGENQENVCFYDQPVVLLMNERTVSASELAVMVLRKGEKVTVLGSNSLGANGNIAYLPLPNGNALSFTTIGVYTPEMGQTQRVGLAPDIEVHPTIEGIKQGRDELMEAAIAYIQEQSQSATAAE